MPPQLNFFFQKLFVYFAAGSKRLFLSRSHTMYKETVTQIIGGQKMYPRRHQTIEGVVVVLVGGGGGLEGAKFAHYPQKGKQEYVNVSWWRRREE